MRPTLFALSLFAALLAMPSAWAFQAYDTPSGRAQIIELEGEGYMVAIGNQVIPLNTYSRSYLSTRVGNYILVSISSGGVACPTTFAWLDTSAGNVRLSETFGTCAEGGEVTHADGILTVTMNSYNASEGMVAFDYDGKTITRRVLGLEESDIAKAAAGNPDAWIGESMHEFLTAAETEADLIAAFGWDDLDQLRNSTIVGSGGMEADGDWIVGSGCRPHMCNTDYGAFAIHRQTGSLLGALKSSGEKPRLIGEPVGALPAEIREVLIRN